MRILYVAHTRFPTEKAHGHQIAQVCGALARLGHDVTLLTPALPTPIRSSPFSYYAMPETLRWVPLPVFDALNAFFVPNPLAFALSMRSYRHALAQYLRTHGADLLYCRSPAVLSPLLASGIPVVLELHTLPRMRRRSFRRRCNACRLVVCLTTAMRDALIGWGMDPRKVIIEGDAVDLSRFQSAFAPLRGVYGGRGNSREATGEGAGLIPRSLLRGKESRACSGVHTFDSLPSREEARKAFDPLPLDQVVVGYVGRFTARNRLDKGVSLLVEAVAELRKRGKDVVGFIVGGLGEGKAAKRLQERASEIELELGGPPFIHFQGSVSPSMVPTAIAACSICVFPAPKSAHPYFVRDTSPLKIFEYMAAEKPIVAADLPPLRDVLDESTAFFCRAGDAEDMAHVLEYVIEHPDEARERAVNARARVAGHTWEKRMGRIIAATPLASRVVTRTTVASGVAAPRV